jgi:RNA polymerase sigma factor
MDAAEISNLVEKAKTGDISARKFLIDTNKGFIRRTSSYICKRNLDWANDDELSIALLSFNEAIESFNPQRGSDFLSYARVLIRSRLVDYFRKNSSVSLSINSMDDEEISSIENKEAMDRYYISCISEERAMEIRMFNDELSEYKLSISELTENSPKHRDTRKTLFYIASVCGSDREIMRSLKKNKMLPIKEIMDRVDVKRKLIEQWRKYLIALLIIVSSDEYSYLKEYISL